MLRDAGELAQVELAKLSAMRNLRRCTWDVGLLLLILQTADKCQSYATRFD